MSLGSAFAAVLDGRRDGKRRGEVCLDVVSLCVALDMGCLLVAVFASAA